MKMEARGSFSPLFAMDLRHFQALRARILDSEASFDMLRPFEELTPRLERPLGPGHCGSRAAGAL